MTLREALDDLKPCLVDRFRRYRVDMSDGFIFRLDFSS